MNKPQRVLHSADQTLLEMQANRVRQAPQFSISYHAVGPISVAIDCLIFLIASVLGDAAYQMSFGGRIDDLHIVLGAGIIGAFAYVIAAKALELYSVVGLQRLSRDYLRIVAAWLFAVLFLTLTFFLLKIGAQISRGSITSYLILSLVLLLCWRLMAKSLVHSALISGAIHGRRSILVGTRDELLSVSESHLLLTYGFNEVDRVTLPGRAPDAVGGSKLELAAINSALYKARATASEEIILALSWANSAQLELVRDQLRASPLPIRLLPDRFIRGMLEPSGGRGALFDIQRGPLTRPEQLAKRLFDIVAASGIILMLAPLLIITALAVKIDSPGRILFRQRRKGFNGQEFSIFKFRTMTVAEDGPIVTQATRNDERVTRVGRVLRRFSIDELPQFFNVLSGEMSVIGPRPHALAHDDEYGAIIDNYAFRHHVKPGITGWAQANGYRGSTPHVEQMKKRVDYDIWYINNWSIWLDIHILAKTVFELSRNNNAY